MRPSSYFVVAAAVAVAGCGGEPAEDPPRGRPPLDAIAVMRTPFRPPADGRLTRDPLEAYVAVLAARREILEAAGNGDLLAPAPPGLGKTDAKRRDKALSAALTRAQMAAGVPAAEFRWVKKRAREVGRVAAGAATDADTREVALWREFADALGGDPRSP